ncbi:MAG TPA: hypothetical protein VF841_16915 [Anaeromyxobacter sp.]
MTLAAVLSAVAAAVPGVRRLARRAWCARQRTRLDARAPRVVWVHDGEKMPWALWGAENDFFELDWADRLPYLRAVAPAK